MMCSVIVSLIYLLLYTKKAAPDITSSTANALRIIPYFLYTAIRDIGGGKIGYFICPHSDRRLSE